MYGFNPSNPSNPVEALFIQHHQHYKSHTLYGFGFISEPKSKFISQSQSRPQFKPQSNTQSQSQYQPELKRPRVSHHESNNELKDTKSIDIKSIQETDHIHRDVISLLDEEDEQVKVEEIQNVIHPHTSLTTPIPILPAISFSPPFTSLQSLQSLQSIHIPSILSKQGLEGYENFVTREEEVSILKFIETQRWSMKRYNRKTMFFGHEPYIPISQCSTIPQELCFLVNRLIERGLFTKEDPPTSVSIQEYVDNQGIGAHVDKLQYGPVIAVISIGNACSIEFQELGWTHDPQYSPYGTPSTDSIPSCHYSMSAHPRFKSFKSTIDNKNPFVLGSKRVVYMPSRSIYVLKQDLRYAYQHSIAKVKRDRCISFKRVSLAFRTITPRLKYSSK
ncbi:MAG: hypothetical protein Sylvanvirus18_4 [Sylvanvirus sp.]|uniref:Fe2OG dioxygenase domain-containing protein n=1 Tax=Sylvanvirus sp. TaxID=2487774 RepID=A0A3G5AK15_9VIRU|nr:MAG: hypothetical protein Sylvanvirus18_4 [Sylvanvirus sp.]